VVETHQILARLPEIAAWAGVPLQTLRPDRGWLFSAPEKHRVLATLDRLYVEDTAGRICRRLMNQYFPEVSWATNAAR
jgi:hypothetical protein